MRPRLVIFDCDGVLVDTESTTNAILSANLARHGLAIAPEECHALFSGGTMQGAGEEARKRGAELPAGWLDDIYEEIFEGLRGGAPVIGGIPDVLDRLDAEGIASAIASNGPPEKMALSLGPSGLHARFEGRIYSRVTHGPPKPDPAMLLAACADAGVSPKDAVMIDDSPAGLLAAARAGVRPIGYANPALPPRLDAATYEIITDMSQLLPRIGLA